MRLDLGAGDERHAGYVSVDLRPGADVTADVRKLPYEDGTVEEVLALDIAEHFPSFDTPDLFAEWNRVLVTGGRLTLRVPNLLLLAREIERNADAAYVDLLIRNVYGGHRWGEGGSLDAHHWGWTPFTIRRDLENAGFRVLDNDGNLNMTVSCVKEPR